MPKLTKSVPKYRKHRASGQAIVTLGGKDHYLGPHGTKASKREYDRLIAEWMSNDRRMPSEATDTAIIELCAAYWKFAQGHYKKRDQGTSELDNIRCAVRPLKALGRRTDGVHRRTACELNFPRVPGTIPETSRAYA